MIVYAIDVNNMQAYSDNSHFILKEVYTDRKAAIDMLMRHGFKPVHDDWKGETVYRWQPTKKNRYGNPDYSNAPFISTCYGVEATLIKCEVVSYNT